MANWSFHLAVGLLTGTAIGLYPALKSIISAGKPDCRDKPTCPAYLCIGRMLVISAAMGILAIIPNIMMFAGLPQSLCRNPLMNIFVLHPLIDRVKSGGILIAELVLVSLFVFHYSLILAAIVRLRHSGSQS